MQRDGLRRVHRTGRRWSRAAFLFLLALTPLLSGCSGCSEAADADTESGDTSTIEDNNSADFSITWNGKTYEYNDSLTNILFLGIDKDDIINTSYDRSEGSGQSDCIMLLSLNEETQQAMIFQINRNAMTEIDIYDAQGNYKSSFTGQVCLQYAYQTGGSASARAAEKTVSELLLGLNIDGYFALDISGVPEINDSLGGVDVTCSHDYTYLDESYTEGALIHLEGEAAQKFVQYRDIEEFNSLEGRMYRQVDYVTSLIGKMNEISGTELVEILEEYLDTYILTDLDTDELQAMRKYEYLTDDVLYLPGETVMGDEHEEFYVDTDELQTLIMETFYVVVEDD